MRRRLLPALLVVTLLVLLADVAGAPLGPLRGVGGTVLGPLERVVSPGRGDALAQAKGEQARLAEELRSVREQRQVGGDVADLLGSPAAQGHDLVPARVVALGRVGSSGPHRVTIDAGERDGVRVDSAVVTADGLAGRVIAVSAWTSDVELLGGPQVQVGVRVGEGGLLGQLVPSDPGTSRAAGELVVTLLQSGRARTGDEVTTLGSASGHPYPAGLVVGSVESVESGEGRLTDAAVVRPAVDTATLDVVGVIRTERRAAPRATRPGASGDAS